MGRGEDEAGCDLDRLESVRQRSQLHTEAISQKWKGAKERGTRELYAREVKVGEEAVDSSIESSREAERMAAIERHEFG